MRRLGKAAPQRSSSRGPLRTCVQCGAVRGKRELVRIAGRPGAGWTLDPEGRSPGRGIYLCTGGECVERFAARVRTQKGGSRWKVGPQGSELAERLLASRAGRNRGGGVDGQGSRA